MNNHLLQSCGSCHPLKDGLQPPLSSYTKEAITASIFAGAVITWKTVSRSGTLPVFDETQFSQSLVGQRFLHQCCNMFRVDLSVRCGCERWLSQSPILHLAAIARETVSRSGTATTSSTGATVKCVPRRPDRWVRELTVHMAGVPVVMYPAVGFQDFPLVMSSVTQATEWYLRFIWDIAPPFCCSSRIPTWAFDRCSLVDGAGAVVPEMCCLCPWRCRRSSEQTTPTLERTTMKAPVCSAP